MTKIKKLTKHGNSYALIIDKPILELLGISDNTLLQVSTPDGSSIVITPLQDKKNQGRNKKFSSTLKRINKKYHRTLKHLAE